MSTKGNTRTNKRNTGNATNKRKKEKEKTPSITFDDVADTNWRDKGDSETMPIEHNLIEFDGEVTVDMTVDEQLEEMENHFFPKTQDDGGDDEIISKLTENIDEDDEEYPSNVLEDIKLAFGEYAQKFYEEILAGKEVKRKTVRKILAETAVRMTMKNPDDAKKIEDMGGEKEYTKWLMKIFKHPAYKDKYEDMIDALYAYAQDEVAKFRELNKDKETESKKADTAEVFLLSQIGKKGESDTEDNRTPRERLLNVIDKVVEQGSINKKEEQKPVVQTIQYVPRLRTISEARKNMGNVRTWAQLAEVKQNIKMPC